MLFKNGMVPWNKGITPESQGGSNDLINLEVYCRDCHFGSNLHLGLREGGK